MKRGWIPFLATTAALALAAVAPAQDRGRGNDDRSNRSSHGSDRPSRSRADHSDARSHDDSRTDRRDTSRDARRTIPADSRSDRGGDTNGGRRSPFDHGNRGGSDRDGGTDRRGASGGAERGGDRDRAGVGDRTRDLREHAVIGSPSRAYQRTPWHYDGRGQVHETRFGAPPSRAVLGVDVRQGGPRTGVSVAVGGVFGGLRVGYVSYSGGGYGDRGYGGYGRGGSAFGAGFGYPYYAYDPYAPDVVVVASPWYRYSYLPPYIDHTRVIVERGYPDRWDWDSWSVYDYERDRDDVAAHDAVNDLQDAFERRSDRIADRLVPLEGQVAIFNGGRYDYSLNPDDFQKMFLDGIDQSKTVRYDVQEVRRRGDEIRIRARHTYEDSWGTEQSVVHEVTLRREHGGDYVVREFGSE